MSAQERIDFIGGEMARRRVTVTKTYVVEGPAEWVKLTLERALVKEGERAKFETDTRWPSEGPGTIELVEERRVEEEVDG